MTAGRQGAAVNGRGIGRAVLAELLGALVPAVDGHVGGGDPAVLDALLADEGARDVLDRLPPYDVPGPGGGGVTAYWDRVRADDPQTATAVLHVLTAAYFADPRVRRRYRLDERPAAGAGDERARLAALLAGVHPAPRLPERA
jgi:hypothetical protein